MQDSGAYVDQVPARPSLPTAAPPALAVAPKPPAQPPRTPAGLYVQVASVPSQKEAVQAGMELAARLGARRPPFIRGVVATVDGQRRIRLFAGPFPSYEDAHGFCGLALRSGEPCLVQPLPGLQTSDLR